MSRKEKAVGPTKRVVKYEESDITLSVTKLPTQTPLII